MYEKTHHLQRVRRIINDYFEDVRVNSTTYVLLENDFLVMALEIERRKLRPVAPWEVSAWPASHDT